MATTVSTAVLKAVPLFATFPEEQLRMLSMVVTRKSAPRSTTIMAGGDPTDSLYIVLSGRLKVMMSDAEGKEVILSILGPGEFFGEIAALDWGASYGRPRLAGVVAIRRTRMLVLDAELVQWLMKTDGDVARTIERTARERLAAR